MRNLDNGDARLIDKARGRWYVPDPSKQIDLEKLRERSLLSEFEAYRAHDPALIAKAADRWYVPDPSKQIDLEKLREKSLLSEFETYKQSKERKLKLFRTEAVRAGFKAAYDGQDYKTIVSVAAKLPENVLQEDEKLLMYYDVASMRLGDE